MAVDHFPLKISSGKAVWAKFETKMIGDESGNQTVAPRNPTACEFSRQPSRVSD
jgi:hypothetical protein